MPRLVLPPYWDASVCTHMCAAQPPCSEDLTNERRPVFFEDHPGLCHFLEQALNERLVGCISLSPSSLGGHVCCAAQHKTFQSSLTLSHSLFSPPPKKMQANSISRHNGRRRLRPDSKAKKGCVVTSQKLQLHGVKLVGNLGARQNPV